MANLKGFKHNKLQPPKGTIAYTGREDPLDAVRDKRSRHYSWAKIFSRFWAFPCVEVVIAGRMNDPRAVVAILDREKFTHDMATVRRRGLSGERYPGWSIRRRVYFASCVQRSPLHLPLRLPRALVKDYAALASAEDMSTVVTALQLPGDLAKEIAGQKKITAIRARVSIHEKRTSAARRQYMKVTLPKHTKE